VSNRTLAVCSLFLAAAGVSAAELVTVDARAVIAWPALTLRAEPSTGGEAVVSVPYGESVAVVSAGEPGDEIRLGSMTGRWRAVRWGNHEGWMFDAWLSSLSAPPTPCDGPEAWVAGWAPQGQPLTEWLEHPATGERFSQQVQHYDQGQRMVRSDHPGAAVGELFLPGVGLPQAWLSVRRCLPALGAIADQGWPPATAGGLSVQRGADELVVADPSGVLLLELARRSDGVWLAWR